VLNGTIFSSLVGEDLSHWFKHGSIAIIHVGTICRCCWECVVVTGGFSMRQVLFWFGRVFVLSVLIHVPLHHSNGLGRVLAEPIEGEAKKLREMAPSECFS